MSISDDIKPGDRVRVSFEATVQWVGDTGIDFRREGGFLPHSILKAELAYTEVEKIRKTLREQYEALPVGARFEFVDRETGKNSELNPRRIKVNNEKYYHPAIDMFHSRELLWIIDNDNFDIKEVGK